MKYLLSKNINFEKWDACISKSIQNTIYGYSWYLDAVSENSWAGLIFESESEYVAVFPIVSKWKGVRYIYQPYFCQQLGYFSITDSSIDQENYEACIAFLTHKFRWVEYSLNVNNPFHSETNSRRTTHFLDLQLDYSELYKNYSTNRKRNLKKSYKNNLYVKPTRDLEKIIKLFKINKGHELVSEGEEYYNTLRRVYTASDAVSCQVLEVVDGTGALHCGAVFLLSEKMIVYVFGAMGELAQKSGAMSYLIDHVIQQNAHSSKILDFEGSEIESIARFYKSFGAWEVYFPYLHSNKLPFYLKILKKSV